MRYDLNTSLNFGKYKGIRLGEILFGPSEDNLNERAQKYIEDVIRFFLFEDFEFNIIGPRSGKLFDKYPVNCIERVNNLALEFLVTDEYILIKSDDKVFTKEVVRFIISYFSLPFDYELTPKVKVKKEDSELSRSSLLISPNISYISWAIKNVDYFYIDEEVFQSLDEENNWNFQSRYISKFNSSIIGPGLIEYKPILDNKPVRLSSDLIELNHQKIDHAVKTGVLNFKQKKESKGKYGGTYAQDYMGYSDQEIDDAFDGIPDAYWNID